FTGVPWMRQHFLGLVEQAVGAVDPDPKRLINALGRVTDSMRTGTNPLEGGMMALVASDEQRVVLDRIGGLMSLLEGHGDVTMDRAGAGKIPAAERFGRVLKERRNAAQGLQRLFQQLIGLEAKIAQYEQGERFIEAVEREGGASLLAEAWVSPDHLPTLEEIRQPARWIDRVRPAVA
ncbi:MAG: zinc-dependent metalloprotease, partial [Acidimicrobiales bacterium]|nr:zinc-dependent metalloprotease [Acidimicrobiales bacterium]